MKLWKTWTDLCFTKSKKFFLHLPQNTPLKEKTVLNIRKENNQDLSDRNNIYDQMQKQTSSGQERKPPLGLTPENPFNRPGSAPQRYYSPSAKSRMLFIKSIN